MVNKRENRDSYQIYINHFIVFCVDTKLSRLIMKGVNFFENGILQKFSKNGFPCLLRSRYFK